MGQDAPWGTCTLVVHTVYMYSKMAARENLGKFVAIDKSLKQLSKFLSIQNQTVKEFAQTLLQH